MTPTSPTRAHGRRIALTGLLAVIATVLLTSSAFAFGAAAIDPTTTGFNTNPGAGNPNNRTEDRTPKFDFTVSGIAGTATTTCTLDGALVSGCGGSSTGPTASYSYTQPTPLSLGSHEFVVNTSDSGPPVTPSTATYTFRIDPPEYSKLVLSHGPYAYWKLDDLASADTAFDAAGSFDGDYKNFVVKRQTPAPTCENQPHPPYACDWNDGTSIDSGRDAQGWSAYFGGRDDHIQIEGMDNPGTPEWAIEAWVKPEFAGESRGIFQHVPSLWTEPGSAPSTTRFACSGLNDEPNAALSGDISNASFTGKWFHVACSYKAGHYKLYVNDSIDPLVGTSATSWSPPHSGGYQGFIGLVNKTDDLWWKGYIDDVAYYDHALTSDDVDWHYRTGKVDDDDYAAHPGVSDYAPPSSEPDPAQVATYGTTSIQSPQNNSQFSKDAQGYKQPTARYSCWDPDVSGTPVHLTGPGQCDLTYLETAGPNVGATGSLANGAPLPMDPGATYKVTITATDGASLIWTHSHTYYVHPTGNGFADLLLCQNPFVASPACEQPIAYYRLNDGAGAMTMTDSSGNFYDGEYKNDQDDSGSNGISGGGANSTRQFFGQGGYAYVNNIDAPLWGYTMELWWKPADDGSMMLMQQGSNGAIYYDGSDVMFRPDERSSNVASFPLPSPSASGNWYYVAATYDGITAKLYVRESTSGNTTLPVPATALAHYQDGAGSADTLYLGYGDQLGGNGWLRGELDEVAYYGVALNATKLTQHFNADPPAGDVHYAVPSRSANSSVAPGVTAVTKTVAKPTSKKHATHKPLSKLAKAKLKVTALTKSLKKAKAKVKALRKHHAKAATIRKANAKVRSLTRQLAKAKAAVKALTKPKPKSKAKRRA